eukprot:451998-Amphidinium_carterae.1
MAKTRSLLLLESTAHRVEDDIPKEQSFEATFYPLLCYGDSPPSTDRCRRCSLVGPPIRPQDSVGLSARLPRLCPT